MENEFVEYDFRMISIKPAHPPRALSHPDVIFTFQATTITFPLFPSKISRALTIKQNIHQGSAGIPG